MTTDLDYISGATILPENTFGISPSSISKFMEKPHLWYREMFLGEKDFNGNTSSVLGTVTHFCAEQYIKHKKVNYEEIYKYIYSQTCLGYDDSIFLSLTTEDEKVDYIDTHCNNPDIDGTYILNQWRPMGQALINHLIKTGVPEISEPMVKAEIKPGYWASGSIDAIRGIGSDFTNPKGTGQIIDYKSTSDLSPKPYIPMNYKYQLLTYAWICSKNGIPIDRISIIWVTNNVVGRISEVTGKPMKDYPTQAVTVTESITQTDLDFIESILDMIASTCQASKDDPSLTWLLFKDPRLRITND